MKGERDIEKEKTESRANTDAIAETVTPKTKIKIRIGSKTAYTAQPDNVDIIEPFASPVDLRAALAPSPTARSTDAGMTITK